MSTDIKLSKVQLSNIIHSAEFLGNVIGNLGKIKLIDLTVPLAKDILPKLATKAVSSVKEKFEKKVGEEP